MSSYIGLLQYKNAQAPAGEGELEIGKAARAAAERNGGRFLSIFWTAGDANMVLTFEGRNEEQATRTFRLEEDQGVTIRVMPAPSEERKSAPFRGQRPPRIALAGTAHSDSGKKGDLCDDDDHRRL